MNRPSWRYYNLLAGDDNVARLTGRTHEVNHPICRRKIEVKVYFGPAHVRVRMHGIPNAAFPYLGKAHHQLAASRAIEVDKPADLAVIRGCCGSKDCRLQGTGVNLCHRITRM